MGTLYYGDNLDILRRYLKDETVDLVYLDPLFNSAQNYNAIFHDKDGASAGFYMHKMNEQQYPRLQLRTVKELMEGKGIERPSNVAGMDETFKKAPESKMKQGHQKEFGL